MVERRPRVADDLPPHQVGVEGVLDEQRRRRIRVCPYHVGRGDLVRVFSFGDEPRAATAVWRPYRVEAYPSDDAQPDDRKVGDGGVGDPLAGDPHPAVVAHVGPPCLDEQVSGVEFQRPARGGHKVEAHRVVAVVDHDGVSRKSLAVDGDGNASAEVHDVHAHVGVCLEVGGEAVVVARYLDHVIVVWICCLRMLPTSRISGTRSKPAPVPACC